MNRIARWDGSAWHPFSSGGQIGVSSDVYALTEYNGDLIAGGAFATAGGQTVNRIARWDSDTSEWHPLTSGGQIGVSSGFVHALTVYNGELIAGGSFSTAGGQTVFRIARWDGSAWHPFESGGQIGVAGAGPVIVRALAVYNGDLIAGGTFTTAGGLTVNRIARWDGSAWNQLASGGQIGVNGTVSALTEYNGDLIAGGDFTTAGGQTVNRIARWDGCADPPIPGDLDGDGVVGFADLLIMLAAWGDCPPPPATCDADLDGDGTVGFSDLLVLLTNWG